jgi:hypothetical protein
MSASDRALLRSRINVQKVRVARLTSELRTAAEILAAMELHLVRATKEAHGSKVQKKVQVKCRTPKKTTK